MNRRDQLHREFYEDLEAAQRCSQRALNALYVEHGPKRSLWFRMALGRAQSILIRLYKMELKRKEDE
jgi:hypothetical protein